MNCTEKIIRANNLQHVNFKDFYTKLCVFSQIKDRKYIEKNFHSVANVMPGGGTTA